MIKMIMVSLKMPVFISNPEQLLVLIIVKVILMNCMFCQKAIVFLRDLLKTHQMIRHLVRMMF